MKTVLITGCSSGYGLETARHFLAQGWKVVATMRTPRPELFPASPNLRLLTLDITDAASVERTLAAAGPIDVLVNNAGIGLFGAFEATPMATVREVFETNTFGTMALCRAVIPAFRQRGAGTIVNVTSSVTLATFPLVAAYAASKAAVASFTASLALELEAFGVRVKLVEPGYGPSTSFATNGQQRMQGLIPPAYEPFAHSVFAGFNHLAAVTSAADVAQSVWQAANDCTDRLHFPAGADAVALAQAR